MAAPMASCPGLRELRPGLAKTRRPFTDRASGCPFTAHTPIPVRAGTGGYSEPASARWPRSRPWVRAAKGQPQVGAVGGSRAQYNKPGPEPEVRDLNPAAVTTTAQPQCKAHAHGLRMSEWRFQIRPFSFPGLVLFMLVKRTYQARPCFVLGTQGATTILDQKGPFSHDTAYAFAGH